MAPAPGDAGATDTAWVEEESRAVMDRWSDNPAHRLANDGIAPYDVWLALVNEIRTSLYAALRRAAPPEPSA
jgi:hypothetical protein